VLFSALRQICGTFSWDFSNPGTRNSAFRGLISHETNAITGDSTSQKSIREPESGADLQVFEARPARSTGTPT
jgi:hypothetical protein